MKASDLDRVRLLLTKLRDMRSNLERLEAVPYMPEKITVFFAYEDEDERRVEEEFELTSSEDAPVRAQVRQLLDARVADIVRQLTELGVDPDA